jgi:predicted DNA-binding transcriptional regulator AlpA
MSDLMDTTAVANYVGLKRETVRWYHKFDKMPPADKYFGRSPVWEKTTIDQWVIDRDTVHTVNDNEEEES